MTDLNVGLTIEKIKSDSDIIREMYENGEVDIVGAMCDVQSGEGSFYIDSFSEQLILQRGAMHNKW